MFVKIWQHINPNCDPHSLDKKHSIGVKDTHYFFWSGFWACPLPQSSNTKELRKLGDWALEEVRSGPCLLSFNLLCLHMWIVFTPLRPIQNHGSLIWSAQCFLNFFGIMSMLAARCTMKNVIRFLRFISFKFEADNGL